MAVGRESEESTTGSLTVPGVDPLIGQVLDNRFRIVEPIGKGGMGKVYRAVQQPLNRAVALKVLDYNYGAGRDEAFRQRFLVEAALTAKLSHPNTITVIDYGCTAHGIFYLAMEYLDGRTLEEVVNHDGPLSWRRALHVGQQIARSLREAHNLGVVHRDLKPANVMLLHADDDTDQVKVLDFGLVKSFVVGQELEGRAETQQGMLMGSPPYMAPEQGEHNRSDPRSDIYSLGTVLYEALTGAPPFMGRNAMEIILKHVHEPVPKMKAPSGLEPIPEEMEAIVLKCLAKSPMDRFQSMEELLQALQELATPQAFATPTEVPRSETNLIPITAEPTVPSSKLLPIALFVLAMAIGGAAVMLFFRQARPVEVVAPPPLVEAPAMTVDETPKPVEPARTSTLFHIESVPMGAEVWLGDKSYGNTPSEFELPLGPDGRSHADVTLKMEGFRPITVTTGGAGERIDLIQKLEKLDKPTELGPVQGPVQKEEPKAPPPKKKVKKTRPAGAAAAPVKSGAKLGDDEDEWDESDMPGKKPAPAPVPAKDELKKPQ